MTPEERFERIEANLERLERRLNDLSLQAEIHDSNLQRIEVNLEKYQHLNELRFQRLTEMQSVLMQSQNDTWKAIDRLTQNIDNLYRGGRPNGHEA